ncbi:hypothetical protein NKI74_32975 [Mesorhizobium sp. M0494]|uniref:hypothetical protein n=1 Tax=Mesorhizobium sp. M0494 TaxID=2956951 RepID=UPI00333A8446
MNNFDQPYTFDLKGQCALLCRRDHLRLGGFVATKLATKIFGANMAQRRSVLSSRTSRAALSYSDAPEWEIINPGLRLGYGRGRGSYGRGASWLAASLLERRHSRQDQAGPRRRSHPRRGSTILSHEQAKDAARGWLKSLKAGNDAPVALILNDVLDRYFEARAAEGMKSIRRQGQRSTFDQSSDRRRSRISR